MSQTNVSTFTNKCTDKWIRQASGMEKAYASSLLMSLKDLRLEVGELLRDGRAILPQEMIFFGVRNLACIGVQMGRSSPQLMGICPPLGAAVLLPLQYGYNAVDIRNVLWLQNFLWIKNWPFYVIRVWRKGVGKRVCCSMTCLLHHGAFAKRGSQCRKSCSRIRKRFFVSPIGWHVWVAIWKDAECSSHHCKVGLLDRLVMGECRWRSLPAFSTWKHFGEVFCFFSFM